MAGYGKIILVPYRGIMFVFEDLFGSEGERRP
jgi:hypothetical protein